MTPAHKIVRLYEGAAPGSEHWTHYEQENFSNPWQTQVVFNVTDPTLTLLALMLRPLLALGKRLLIRMCFETGLPI